MRDLLRKGLGRLSVGRKLLLIFLLDMSAVAFISGILINEKYLSIDFARKEVVGNAYLGVLREALVASAGSVAEAAPRGAMATQAAALEAAELRLGSTLATASEAEAFAKALRSLDGAPAGGTESRLAIERGRALVTRVGNQSNLILDPDLDSYYAMSIVTLRAPELLDVVAGMSTHLLARGDSAGTDWRTRFLILEGQLDAVRQGIESDFAEAFAASKPALAQSLDPARKGLMAALEHYRGVARETLDAPSGVSREGAVREAHAALLTALDGAWADTSHALDGLLQARIDGFFARMWLHLGTALALLGGILMAVFFVARQIALPLQRLSQVAETVRGTGDHSLRAQWDSRDEIGRLVGSFNDMLAQLDRHREVQQELAASARAAQAQQQLVEAMPIPLVVTAVPGHQVLHANAPAQAWLGGRTDDPWRRGLEKGVGARFFQELQDRGAVDEFEVRWRPASASREPSWAVLSARRVTYQDQEAVLTAFTPINHLKQLEGRLNLWSKVFEASSEGIVIVDGQRRVLSVNRAFSRATLYDAQELAGDELAIVEPGTGNVDSAPSLEAICNAADQKGHWTGEATVRRRDGNGFPAWLMVSAVREKNRGAVEHFIVICIDISDRKRSEERIRLLADHDVLTELPNRSLCIERLRHAVQQAKRSRRRVAVLFIDLDRFKNINDSLGHHVGDALLRSVSQRLVESVRAGDTVSRLGGDEFVVVLSEVDDVEEVAHVVDQRLVPLIRRPHAVAGTELHVSCSVGIALYPDDAEDIDELMRHADAAMYQAKASGRDAAVYFTPELNERAQRRLELESHLRHAAARGEFALHFQPRVDGQHGRLVGVEALLRWHSPELGAVPPARFIPIAEESGLIAPIGDWVLDAACAQHARWRDEGLGHIPVSLNVSPLQLRDGQLVEAVRLALERHAVPAGMVELELTETALMENIDHTLSQLHALRRLGVTLAIDDFGTGYSSLNYLHRFPIDRLKIDRSFVHGMHKRPADLAITRAVVGLGHALSLRVVGEGVETEQEAQTLRGLGCDELQGFLYGRPMPAAELAAWAAQRSLAAA